MKFIDALIDVFWVLCPLIIVAVASAWAGAFSKMPEHPDMMVVSSVLFGEGAWHALQSKRKGIGKSEKDSAALIGFLGFAFSCMAIFVLVQHSFGKSPAFMLSLNEYVFWLSAVAIWLCSFLYAIYVRVKI